MNLQQILAFLAPYAGLLKPELLKLEGAAMAELNMIIASTQSPDLKLVFEELAMAADAIAKQEIAKI